MPNFTQNLPFQPKAPKNTPTSAPESERAELLWLRLLGALTVIAIAAALRLVPHPANFSPIGAMALFGGAYVRWPKSRLGNFALACLMPLSALFLSDLALGFHDQMGVVYGAFILTAVIGFSLGQRKTPSLIGLASVSSSILFFVMTNFSVWLQSGMYEKSASGLGLCYLAAIPFFQNALVGDLFYTALLFGSWALVETCVPKLRTVQS